MTKNVLVPLGQPCVLLTIFSNEHKERCFVHFGDTRDCGGQHQGKVVTQTNSFFNRIRVGHSDQLVLKGCFLRSGS